MTAEQLRAWLKRTGHDLLHGEAVEEKEAESDVRRALRSRVAIGIVLLSVFSAVAGWRASVFDERSSSSGASFHQALVVQQQLEGQHEATIARDITQYGEVEQHWFMAAALRRDAGAPAAGSSLASTAEAENVAAEQELNGFEARSENNPQPYSDGTVSYNPAVAYAHAVAADTELAGLHPEAPRDRSDIESHQALHMTGIAVMFIAALVLLTLAQVTLGRRLRGAQRAADGWSVSHTLALAGTLVALVAAALFAAVLVQ